MDERIALDGRLRLDDADVLSGTFPAAAEKQVTIYHRGARWAGVPARIDAAGGATFSCQLPPVREPCEATIEVRDASGERVFEREVFSRKPRVNGYGLSAYDVFALAHPPLNSIPWLTFDGVQLRIGGGHLPPGGDPSSLSVRFGPGVVYTFEYPLPSPGWDDYYWYWPNAAGSNLTITIDLLASRFDADPFHFAFVETKDGETKKLSDIWLPGDLHSFLSLTSDVAKIERVQRGQDAHSIVLPGYSHFRYLESQFARFGIVDAPGVSILDWGCGVGRLSAHFVRQWRRARTFGTDIDADNVRWCAATLGEDRFAVAPLWPPASYPDETFDGVFGVSVMTHLTADAQAAWLGELARILKPGGIALLTFAGPAGTAAGSLWRSAAWWKAYSTSGFDAEIRDAALEGFIADSDYYRQTNQTHANVTATWSRHFEVLETIEAAFGNQDLAILRKR